MEKIKKYYAQLKQVSHINAIKMNEMQENVKDLEEEKMEKNTVSTRVHGHVGSRWDGIHQYFREKDHEKEKVEEKDAMDSGTAYWKEEDRLGETKENIKKEHENIGSRWVGIQQYFGDTGKAENLEEYDIEDLNTIYAGENKLDSKADVAKRENKVIINKWGGLKQYFTKKDEQRNLNPDESVPKDPSSLSSERTELIANTSITERMRKNAGSKWITIQQYFREKNFNKKENTEENRPRESNDKFQDPECSGHIVGTDYESQQNPHTVVEEEICTTKFKQLSSAHVSKSNNELKETISLQSSNKTPIVVSGVYSQNRVNWGTDYTMGKELEGTWKVGCKLRLACAKRNEFQWKVKLKLKPLRKFISIQLIQNSSSITNSGKLKILDVPRKYKIVFVGDSGVGKTSFIRRYCNKSFKSSFHSTVGVDYREREVSVDGKLAVLQFWDTAGQERYRSMCVQYYRNADAVVAIYDITAEQSFKNVRGWMDNIKEVTDDGRIILLIGNKIDAVDFKLNNAVRTAHGALLAEEYGALFFETSVKYDESVNEAMTELIKLLEKKIQQEKKLTLEDKKNSEQKCC